MTNASDATMTSIHILSATSRGEDEPMPDGTVETLERHPCAGSRKVTAWDS